MSLNLQQKKFADEYLIDLNATQAAIRAGYSENSAYSQGHRLLKNDEVQEYLSEKAGAISKSTQVDAEYVRMRHKEIDDMDVLDIFLDDMSGLRPLSEWPKVWRTTISGIDISELFEYPDGEKELSGFLKKIKWPDKVRNLELLGKHTDVGAYKERIEANVSATHNIMPVPTASSAEDWEAEAQRQQAQNIGK